VTQFGVGFEVLAKRFNHSYPRITMRYMVITDAEVNGILLNEISGYLQQLWKKSDRSELMGAPTAKNKSFRKNSAQASRYVIYQVISTK
jgi:hypothetical protein